jgi:hypothetical protein
MAKCQPRGASGPQSEPTAERRRHPVLPFQDMILFHVAALAGLIL